MFAIVEIAGKQYKVSEKDTLEVDRLPEEKGSITFDKVLLYSKDDKDVQVGTPYLNGASIKAEIVERKRGEKIRVFKIKPKKRYQRTIGHRRDLTVIEIVSISGGTATTKPKAAPKQEEAKQETVTAPEPKEEGKSETPEPKVEAKKEEAKVEDVKKAEAAPMAEKAPEPASEPKNEEAPAEKTA